MTNFNCTKFSQQGLTLIELLVALTLGAFLLDGVIQTFIAARQTYRVHEGLSRLQENGRFAIEFIDRDVRMAGFRGCNSKKSIAGASNHLAASFVNDFDTAIEGFESISSTAWSPAMNAAITSPRGGSDVITIRRADENGHIVSAHAAPANNITLTSATGLSNGDNVLIADCSNAEVFQITNITGTNIAHGAVLTNNYPTGEVFPISTTSYYISNNDDGRPSLYRRIGTNNREELIEGIEDMQILYGEDTDLNPATGLSTDSAANYYVPANAVVNLIRVVSVRINLLVATPDDNATAELAPYTDLAGNFVATPGDHRIRRIFTSTIALRNRLN